MKDSRLKSFLEPITPRFVRRALRPGVIFRDWQRSLGDRLVECHAGGVTIQLGVSSEMERFRAQTFATKEPETIAWLDANLRPDDVLFDIGANVGVYTLYAAKRSPQTRIYSFEPEALNFARLCRNVHVNGTANVVPCSLAISGETGFGMFDVRRMEAGAALHGISGTPTMDQTGAPPVTRQGVATVTMDTLVAKYGIPQPSLIKVDVDGVEEQIFEGAENVLKNPVLRTVLVEINLDPAGPSAIERCMDRHGFKLVDKSKWTSRFGAVESRNHVYARPSPS